MGQRASVGLSAAQVGPIPAPATSPPPGVTDAGSVGTTVGQYAMADHTHASKARKAIVPVSAATAYTWTYPTPFGAGIVPICNGIAQTAAGVTDLINVQIQGTPTNTQCTFAITRYQQSVVALLGLTILATPGVGFTGSLHLIAFEP
jgi:hypothetical protein